MFAGSKAKWYTITDDLPQHPGYPPEYGGGLGIEPPPSPRAPERSRAAAFAAGSLTRSTRRCG